MKREIITVGVFLTLLVGGFFSLRHYVRSSMDEAAEQQAQAAIASAKAEAKLSPADFKAKMKTEHAAKEKVKSASEKRMAENKKRVYAERAKQKADKENAEKKREQFKKQVIANRKKVAQKSKAPVNAGPPVPSVEHVAGWVAAKEEVLSMLKSPTSAEFPYYDQSFVFKRKPNEMQVTGYVDADNSYGAKIRNNFVCEVAFTDKYTSKAVCILTN